MGIRVFDNATQTWVETDSADAGAGHLEGRYGLPDAGRVRVRLADGQVGDVDAAEAHTILGEGGTLLDEQEYEAQRETTTGEDIEAGVQGFAEGVSGGAGEAALLQGIQHARTQDEAEDYRRALAQQQMVAERSPTAHGIGEVGGFITGAVATGGGAAAAERGGMSLAQRLVRTGVREGVESALQQVPTSVNRVMAEEALGDHRLTAEQMLAQIGVETLLAGGTGGIFGVGSRLAGHGAEAIGARLTPHIRAAISNDAIQDFAERSAFKASGAMLADFRRATRSMGADGPRTIGRRLLDEGVVTWDASLDDIATRAAARTDHHGRRIGELLGELDGTASRANVDRIAARIENEVLDPLRRSPFHRNVLGQVEDTLDGFRSRFASRVDPETGATVPGEELTWTGLHEQRRALDDLIWRNRGPNPPQWIEEARKARRILEEELEDQGQLAADGVGADFAAAYRDAKQGYAAMKTARDVANDRLLRDDANRFFSPSDYGIGSVGALLGGGGLDPGSLAMGFLTGAVHKVVRERGRAFIAAGLDRVSRLTVLQQTAQKAETRVAGALQRFLAPPVRAGRRVAAAARRRAIPAVTVEAFHERVRQLEEESRPEQRVEQIAEATQLFADAAPKTTAAVTELVMRRDAYLRSRIPAGMHPTDSLQPHLARPRVPSDEMHRFMRCARAADNPLSVVEDLEHGRITREGVDALREVYPELYKRVQTTVMEQLAEAKEPIPFEQSLRLGILLQIPTHPSLQPRRLAMLQATYAQTSAQPQTPAASPQMAQLDVSGPLLSETQRLTARRSG